MNGIGYRSAQEYEGGWNSDNELNGARCAPSSKPAGKQLQHVARQFGSLGRSVGRRIKRNLLDNFVVKHATGSGGSTVVRPSNCHWECPDFILCARLHTERHHPCLEQMINNYLQSARYRFRLLCFYAFVFFFLLLLFIYLLLFFISIFGFLLTYSTLTRTI